jgi:AcrR family transcriptional regulator
LNASSDNSNQGKADSGGSFRARLPVDLCKRGELRVERFLDAATEVFTEKGYQHARLSEIVARAGGSLATLYRVFGDKEGLAHAIIQRRLEDLSARLPISICQAFRHSKPCIRQPNASPKAWPLPNRW